MCIRTGTFADSLQFGGGAKVAAAFTDCLPACHACAPSLPACRLPSILPSPMYSVLCIDLISILHYFVIVSMCAVIFMEFFEQLQIEGFLRLDDIQKQFCYPQTILERRRAFYPQVILHSLIIHKSSFNNVAQIK